MNNASDDASILDLEALLANLGGDQELLEELTRLFMQEAPGLLARVSAAVSRQDSQELRFAAHTLKGAASNFYATATVRAALRLEQLGRDEDFTQAPAALEELERHLARLIPALSALAGHRPTPRSSHVDTSGAHRYP